MVKLFLYEFGSNLAEIETGTMFLTKCDGPVNLSL
jgi:hypothetical protein